MQFHATSVSTSIFADDYYQVIFEAEEQAEDLPYLLIQRQFEDANDVMSRHVTKNTLGIFFCAASNSLHRDCPSSSIARKDNLLSVTFTMAPSDFEEASQVVKIIAGQIEPQ